MLFPMVKPLVNCLLQTQIIMDSMKRKAYSSPLIFQIPLDVEHPVLEGSVIMQNNMIKATNQEVNYVDFSDDDTFKLDWE